MIETIIKGITIGIIVSAPMGPTGVLCVQRSLNKGRWSGFATGLGAALSDLIYALITSCGISFIIGFLELHKVVFQILGSIFLLLFSYLVFKSNPSCLLPQKQITPTPYWKDFISSFFLTLSNAGIVFLFIVLYARFNFIHTSFTQNIIGVVSVCIGAVIWWFGITSLIHRLRAYFNIRQLRAFNIILGSILLAIGIVGIITGIAPQYF